MDGHQSYTESELLEFSILIKREFLKILETCENLDNRDDPNRFEVIKQSIINLLRFKKIERIIFFCFLAGLLNRYIRSNLILFSNVIKIFKEGDLKEYLNGYYATNELDFIEAVKFFDVEKLKDYDFVFEPNPTLAIDVERVTYDPELNIFSLDEEEGESQGEDDDLYDLESESTDTNYTTDSEEETDDEPCVGA